MKRDLDGLVKWLKELTGRKDVPEFSQDEKIDGISEKVTDFIKEAFKEKSERLGKKLSRSFQLRLCSV